MTSVGGEGNNSVGSENDENRASVVVSSGHNKEAIIDPPEPFSALEDAKTGKNTAELARRMGMQPSALQNALSRGSIPFRGVFNYCKTETKPMEYFLTGYDPFDQEEFNRRINMRRIN